MMNRSFCLEGIIVNIKIIQRIICGGCCFLAFAMVGCLGEKSISNNSDPYTSRKESVVRIETYNSKDEKIEESFAEKPNKIVAIWQGPIETLIALGVQDRIVAAIGLPDSIYLKPEYREAYEKIPYKSFAMPSREEIVQLQPDFIVTSWKTFTNRSIGDTGYWQERGVKTYIAEIPRGQKERRTVEQEYKFIRDMGMIFNVQYRAEEIIGRMQDKMTQVTAMADKNKESPSTMIVQYMGKRLMNWGDDYLQGDIVKKLHGRLLLQQKGFISEEELLQQNPDVIFLMVNEWDYANQAQVLQRFYQNPILNSLDAIHNRRVYLLPLYEGQYSGVRTEDGIYRIARGLYPNAFNT